MNLMGLFRSPQNELEKGGKQLKNPQEEQHEITMTCPKCGTQTPVSELWDDLNVCRCGHHFRMTARQRISFLADDDTFTELDADMTSHDILEFPNYENKLKSARLATREKEAVVCGTAKVMGEDCAVFCMDPHFMMGSMGTVVGEKITRLFEYATEHRLSVIGFTAAGGALALAVADRVWILENAVYSVVSPEGCASILWKDAKKAKEAAECLHLTAQDMEKLGVVERVISESGKTKAELFSRVKEMLAVQTDELCKKDTETLLKERYERFRKY